MTRLFVRIVLRIVVAGSLCLAFAPLGSAQSGAVWTVRPEWVKAHEDFLASDALAGRGSATRDEQLAALYVASEFEAYGLQRAPGMTSFLQEAEVDMPALDGHAALVAGTASLHEGDDFDLLQSSGEDAGGPLIKMAAEEVGTKHFERGAAILLSGDLDGQTAYGASYQLRRAGARIVLLNGGGQLADVYSRVGGRTQTPIRLMGEPETRQRTTLIVLRPARFTQLAAEPEGTALGVSVHRAPKAAPRMTYNALGYLPGTDLTAGTLLLTAHLDHLGLANGGEGDRIYNGANDDASGTTAVLELAHALASGPRLRRSVLFVCYGSEEIGELGSTYFGQHSPVPLKELVANIEFEMIGNQDPKTAKGVLSFTGYERSDLGPALKAHGALLGPDPYPEEHFFERSDNYALALRGVVAHTAAGWGTPPTYHKPDDDLQHLDLAFMTQAIQSLVEPVRWLASSDFVPHWNPGGQPKGR